jgi:Bacterial regulatory proteins, tetR family
MNFNVSFKVNETIYLRDPESSELGQQILCSAIDLINDLGFEQFTFKKLALEINTTEASIYRYFENKHRLLLYIINWYWSYLEFLVVYQLKGITNAKQKLNAVLNLLTHELPTTNSGNNFNYQKLNKIVIVESSKVFLVKEVDTINKNQVYKPYKDLCAQISNIIVEIKPQYKYPHSLSSTLIESAHHQQFFSTYLPKLTDCKIKDKSAYAEQFLQSLMNGALGLK